VSALPGEALGVVVSGEILGQSTFGVNVMVELVPRPGATGTVRFTPAPPTDITQLGDPWPEVGAFNPYDTDVSFSELLNGSVDGDGLFVPNQVWFSGPLAEYPLEISPDAHGVWDVNLCTSVGDSSWEGLTTTLTPGTITVLGPHEVPTMSAWACAILGLLLATAATLLVSDARARRAA
jgi:hypothetical protein